MIKPHPYFPSGVDCSAPRRECALPQTDGDELFEPWGSLLLGRRLDLTPLGLGHPISQQKTATMHLVTSDLFRQTASCR